MFLYHGTTSLLSVTCGRHPVASPSLLNYFLIISSYVALNIGGDCSSCKFKFWLLLGFPFG